MNEAKEQVKCTVFNLVICQMNGRVYLREHQTNLWAELQPILMMEQPWTENVQPLGVKISLSEIILLEAALLWESLPPPIFQCSISCWYSQKIQSLLHSERRKDKMWAFCGYSDNLNYWVLWKVSDKHIQDALNQNRFQFSILATTKEHFVQI